MAWVKENVIPKMWAFFKAFLERREPKFTPLHFSVIQVTSCGLAVGHTRGTDTMDSIPKEFGLIPLTKEVSSLRCRGESIFSVGLLHLSGLITRPVTLRRACFTLTNEWSTWGSTPLPNTLQLWVAEQQACPCLWDLAEVHSTKQLGSKRH